MDIVLSKNGVKCAVFKISDVQILLYYPFELNSFLSYMKICYKIPNKSC